MNEYEKAVLEAAVGQREANPSSVSIRLNRTINDYLASQKKVAEIEPLIWYNIKDYDGCSETERDLFDSNSRLGEKVDELIAAVNELRAK